MEHEHPESKITTARAIIANDIKTSQFLATDHIPLRASEEAEI